MAIKPDYAKSGAMLHLVSPETAAAEVAIGVESGPAVGQSEILRLCVMLEQTWFRDLSNGQLAYDIRPSIALMAQHCSRDIRRGVRNHFIHCAYRELQGDRTQRIKMLLAAIQRHSRTVRVRGSFAAALTIAGLFRALPGKSELYRLLSEAL